MKNVAIALGVAITLVVCGGSALHMSSRKMGSDKTQKVNIEIHGLSLKANHEPRIYLSSKHDFKLIWKMNKQHVCESTSVYHRGALRVSELIDSLKNSGYTHVQTTDIPSNSPDSVVLILSYGVSDY